MSNLIDIYFDDNTNTLYNTWKQETKQAKWEEMKDAMNYYADKVLEYKPQNILIDERNLKYTWIPENQEWVDENIVTKAISVNVKKHAIIQSDDIFQATAAEQLMDEENAQNLSTQFFNNKEDAEKWLKE